MRIPLKQQIRTNLVAIISLMLALLSLSYNTWRNEVTEHNRNVREAGFEVLVTLGELHEIIFFLHYDKDAVRGNPRLGWTKVLLVNDLATIMPGVTESADSLRRPGRRTGLRWGRTSGPSNAFPARWTRSGHPRSMPCPCWSDGWRWAAQPRGIPARR